MKIPQFWARASRDGFEAPGWSFSSLAEAKKVAEQRVALLVEVLTGKRARLEGKYLYGDRPVREPVVEELGPEAVVTRNSYGALCLNTQDVAFVDVDVKDPSVLTRLLAAVRASDIKDPSLDRIRKAQAGHPDWALRIYRTRAGFRVVAVHARMQPGSAEAQQLMDALGADPLYRKLCAAQDSFRARLTPKPWRMDMRRLPATFPWRDAGVERTVNEWVAEYDEARDAYAVCQLLETLGTPAQDPVIDRILQFHDTWCVADGKPLA